MTNRAEKCFWCVLLFCALFHVVHLFALPILVTYDGSEYVRLGDLLTSPKFWQEYTFRRPPVYPFLLKASMYAIGRHPIGAQIPNVILGFCGIALIALALRRMGRPVVGMLCALLMTFDPVLISYEHAILTEASSFFCMALVLYFLVATEMRDWVRTTLLALSLAFAYYQRPTLVYLAPVAAFIHAADLLLKQPQCSRAEWFSAIRHFALVTILPFIIAGPWNRLIANSKEANFGQQILLYGVLKQAVLSPDDPALGPSRENYLKAIETCAPGGKMDWAGLSGSSLLPVEWEMLSRCETQGKEIFWRAVTTSPLNYFRGVGRTLVYFSGVPNIDEYNQSYVVAVITDAGGGSKLQGPSHWQYEETKRDFMQKGSISLISRGLNRLNPLYRILLPLSAVVTALGLILAFIRRDAVLCAFCALPLALFAMHALTLIAVDRYAMPAYPIMLANLFVVPGLLIRRRNTETVRTDAATQSFATAG